MKKLLVFLAMLGLAGPVVAETDYIALPILKSIQSGEDNKNRIEDLLVGDDATINDDLTVSGTTILGATTVTTFTATTGITSGRDIDAGINQVEADQIAVSTNGTEVGYFAIFQNSGGTNQLIFIAGAVTNVIIADVNN